MPSLSTSLPISSITRINSTIKDLFIYLYDLSPLDLDLLIIMIQNKKQMTLEQLARKVDRDKSTTFRSLKKLVGLGICMKETKSIKEGGYYHLYSAVDVGDRKKSKGN
jgi:predicted transcriptional regulator